MQTSSIILTKSYDARSLAILHSAPVENREICSFQLIWGMFQTRISSPRCITLFLIKATFSRRTSRPACIIQWGCVNSDPKRRETSRKFRTSFTITWLSFVVNCSKGMGNIFSIRNVVRLRCILFASFFHFSVFQEFFSITSTRILYYALTSSILCTNSRRGKIYWFFCIEYAPKLRHKIEKFFYHIVRDKHR